MKVKYKYLACKMDKLRQRNMLELLKLNREELIKQYIEENYPVFKDVCKEDCAYQVIEKNWLNICLQTVFWISEFLKILIVLLIEIVSSTAICTTINLV